MGRTELSQKEIDIMQVLWKNDKPLFVSEIVSSNKEFSLPTVQRLLKKLEKRGYIQVADIVQHGKALARRYSAKISVDDFLKEEINFFFPIVENKIGFSADVLAVFFNQNTGEDAALISELESLIVKKKKELGYDRN